MGGMSLGGLVSGLDTKALIEQLMAIEQQPLNLLQQKKSALNTKNQMFQTVNTRILALKGAASELTLDLNLKARKTTSSDTNVVTAKAGAGAAASSYQIRVKQLATATTLSSSGGVGKGLTPADGATLLKDVKGTAPITSGTFTVQWKDGADTTRTATITVDANADTLDDVFARIGAATNGADATSDVTFAIGDGVSPAGSANKIVVSAPNAKSVIMGAGSDTSNFLSALSLRTQTLSEGAVGRDVMSANGVGVTQMGGPIQSANLATAPAASGTFKINGVELSYNAATESLNDVISKINASKAGVTANYNALEDKITLTARTTGSSAISVEDGTGTLMASLGLTNGSVSAGKNAMIGIIGVNGFKGDGTDPDSAYISSSTNEFKSAIPGVIFTALKAQAPADSNITITVAADPDATLGKVKAFVDQYNQLVDSIASTTAKGQPNAFDSDLRQITDRIRTMLARSVTGLSDSPKSLVDIGIATSKDDRIHLSLDETKFKKAMDENPERVAQIFQLTETDPSDSKKKIDRGIAAQIKTYLTNVGSTDGVFKNRDRSVQRQLRGYDDQIAGVTKRLASTRQAMVQQFTAMEKAVSRLKTQQSAFLSQISSLGQG
ncbi:flagellar filament capping protein FliD [bacterium]|nr:flagellar filament capping protein FliD [bacterium]